MPANEVRTTRRIVRTVAAALGARAAEIRSAAAGLVDGLIRGLGPAPVLQPIPVRVRRQRRS
jgi:hypothetical protein